MEETEPLFSLKGPYIPEIIASGVEKRTKREFRTNGETTFHRCKIVGEFEINHSHRYSYNTNVYPAKFDGCVFEDKVIITDVFHLTSLTFTNCVFKGQVRFQFSKIAVTIENNCEFKDAVYLNLEAPKAFSISNVIFENTLLLQGSYRSNVSLHSLNLKDDTLVRRGKLVLKQASFDSFELVNSSFSKIEIVDNCQFFYDAIFNKIEADSFILLNSKICTLLKIEKTSLNQFAIDNISSGVPSHRYLEILNQCQIVKASIPLHMLDKTHIGDSFFGELSLWGTNVESGIFNIQKTAFDKLIFVEVYNKGIITLRELKNTYQNDQKFIVIRSSNLGRTDFINCDFLNDIFEFNNSKISEIFVTETDFPKTVMINGSVSPTQAQLAFGQLHTAFQKQGDSIRALEYQAREVESHYQLLSWFNKGFPYINSDKLNLWFNKWSNNFGRYWMRGVLFTFCTGILFFYFLILSTKEYSFGFPISFDPNFVASYLRFLNPFRFRELETLFTFSNNQLVINITYWSYVWDFLGRVFITYGFYQTIQAFRRYGRKS